MDEERERERQREMEREREDVTNGLQTCWEGLPWNT